MPDGLRLVGHKGADLIGRSLEELVLAGEDL